MHWPCEALPVLFAMVPRLGFAIAFVMVHFVALVALLSISRTFLSFSSVAPPAIVAFGYGLTRCLGPGQLVSEVRWLHCIHVGDLVG